MTPEQRLEQIEILMVTAAKNINANIVAIAKLTEKQDRLTENQDRLTENQLRSDARIGEAVEIIVDTLKIIREMQTEVKGLQIENRRILEHLFGENQQPPEDEVN